ncbi:MAG TPA: hypothetical protein VH088_04850 [Terriglobales bacterium]|jgi:hypothetical protein|nr:hypothetical protein [Terriglobales bacterium]
MTESTSDLAVKAHEERSHLQASFEDLKERMHETLDVEAQVRKNVLPISGIAGLTAAVIGYGIAGIFSRR